MYVKVHKKGNQWFRNDNGTLVGTEVDKSIPNYQKLSKLIGNQIIIKDKNNELKQLYYGYFYNGRFKRLDISQKCSSEICGYYAFVIG